MNKKLLAVISVLGLLIFAMGGYIIGTKSQNNQVKTAQTKSSSSESKKEVSSSSSAPSASSSSSTEVIISTSDAESQLNSGQSIDGKIVDVDVFNVENATELGQNLQAGEHLNFYPATQQYGLKNGDHIKFKVSESKSTLGSWLITGDVVK
ncbi:hypothetical protein [Leuconostoc miyukkimchii]|uniref:hypothetical protein n=1 Tax=Leuconostoc miyukkimchii TaxID=910540 RepID=UPI001C7CBBEF|nr:hypothetical protein [Leuconostoc miyukkimchii]